MIRISSLVEVEKVTQVSYHVLVKLKIILGSTRQKRFGDKPANWILNLAKNKNIDTELLDLRDYPMPFFDEPESPSMAKEPFKNEIVQKWTAKIAEAEAFIIITPEYNHGYPAVLKNALDYVYKEWNKKPVAFVSYGGAAGGTRSVQQLRQVAIELQMVPIREGVHFANYWNNLDTTGNLKTTDTDEKAASMLDSLSWWSDQLKK